VKRLNEALTMLESKEFLDSLYGFAFKRTSSSYEAEDLCSDIILAILKGIRKNTEIKNPHAFVWTVARRVYADFSKKRRIYTDTHITNDYSDEVMHISDNPIDEYFNVENDKTQLKRIMREIAFLSKLYRVVCVMYYLDELKISDIAARLVINENTIKQRLFFSRTVIKKGVNKMNTDNLTLKPMQLADDLQDIKEDSEMGYQTIFTIDLSYEHIEKTVNKILHFIHNIMVGFQAENDIFKEFILSECYQLVYLSIIGSKEYFSNEYLDRLEKFLPVTYLCFEDFMKYKTVNTVKTQKKYMKMLDDILFSN